MGTLTAALGLLAAVVVYVLAAVQPEVPSELGPLDSKQYRHELEVYGGKANVVFSELMDWFDGLWHGTSLAYTIAAVAVLVVLVLRSLARALEAPRDADEDASPPRAPPG